MAFGTKSLAMGNETYVYANESVGIGNNVQALNNQSMAYGRNAYAGGLGSIAIGSDTFANVTMDEEFKQIENNYETGNTVDLQDKYKSKFKPKTTLQSGTGEQKAENSTDKNKWYNSGAISIGSYSIALGDNSLALGRFAYAKEEISLSLGRFTLPGTKIFQLGSFSRAMGGKSIAFGPSAIKR